MSARVPYLTPEDLPENDRDLIRSCINLQRGLANNPAAMRMFSPIGRWMRWQMPLDARLREMAVLQVAFILRSGYEFSHHLKIMDDFGVTQDDVRAIIAETRGERTELPELDRAVLLTARTLTVGVEVSDQCWATLHDGLGTERAMEVILTVGFYNHLARVIAGLKLETEPEYAQLLDQYEAMGIEGWR